MLRPLRVLRPGSIAEASGELRRLGDEAKVYAGGAELVLLLRHKLLECSYLVDIKRIPSLGEVAWDGRSMRIGAAVTHHRLETDPLVRERLPLLVRAESHVGNIRVRSQGTLGGNLCFCDPHADPATALLVHDPAVTVASAEGERRLPLSNFLVDTYQTALAPDELLIDVEVPPLPPGWGHAYLRIERFYRPTLNVAAAARWAGNTLAEVKLAVGCVGPKALRLGELEAELRGAGLQDALGRIKAAKRYLGETLQPVDDLLGSAEYKLHITRVLLGRALSETADNHKEQRLA